MNLQDIKRKAAEASEEYMDSSHISGPRGSYRKGFIAGAKYAISSLLRRDFECKDNSRKPVLIKLNNGLYSLIDNFDEIEDVKNWVDYFVFIGDIENGKDVKGKE